MKEYSTYFANIDISLKKCDSLSQVNVSSANDVQRQQYLLAYRAKLAECKKKSKRGNFNLTDLLRLPYQRVLKYHLLFNELLNQTFVEHAAKEAIEQCRDSMKELGNYLNECQRDKENLTFIEQVGRHLFTDLNLNNTMRQNNSTHNNNGTGGSGHYSTSLNSNHLKNYGHYIKDGKFKIKSLDQGELYSRSKSFFLFERALIICKSKGSTFNCKEILLINDYSIEETLNTNTSFNILNNSISQNSSLLNNVGVSSSGGIGAEDCLYLIKSDESKKYQLTFKNRDMKKVWKEVLLNAKRKVRPDGQRAQKHFFELTNFDTELVKCFVCDKYLLGLFYQGYKCFLCGSIAHKDCLTRCINICTTSASPPSPPPLPRTLVLRSESLTRQLCSSASSPPIIVQIAKASYNYDGRPRHPDGLPLLVFNRGDIIQITDDDDEEWTRGFKLSSTKTRLREEGYFPKSYVEIIQILPPSVSTPLTPAVPPPPPVPPPLRTTLQEQLWFASVDRSMAELILQRVPAAPYQTIFMVRDRTDGGYAITIRYLGGIQHIRVNQFSSTLPLNDQQIVYSIDQQRQFNSIPSLVLHYTQNILKDNFPELDTTLGIPYRNALPRPISIGTALHDYNPMHNQKNNAEQIELKKSSNYFIFGREENGWVKVYNSDGLIGYAPSAYLMETRTQE
jgi:guanine nucleotide exchange factor VAV